jgi:hypothetical protein
MTFVFRLRSWFHRLFPTRRDEATTVQQYRALFKLKNEDAGVKW